MQKFDIAAKNGGKVTFWKNLPVDSGDTLWAKNFVEITLSCSISEINASFCKNLRWRKNDSALSRAPLS